MNLRCFTACYLVAVLDYCGSSLRSLKLNRRRAVNWELVHFSRYYLNTGAVEVAKPFRLVRRLLNRVRNGDCIAIFSGGQPFADDVAGGFVVFGGAGGAGVAII